MRSFVINGIPYPYSVAASITGGSSQVVSHGLGAIPIVVALDSSNNEVDLDITHDSVNQFTVSSPVNFTGTFYYRL